MSEQGKETEPKFEKNPLKLSLDSLTADWVTNVRADPGDVTELARSIHDNDLQNAIVVRPSVSSPGLYEIVEGSRRVAAYRLLAQQDPKYKKIEAKILRNCDDVQAAIRSFDENDKRGNLTVREVASYIDILQRNSPHDPASKDTTRWVAEKLGWMIEGRPTKKGKRKFYPDVARVNRALQDAEFQKLVPGVEIKVRSRGDMKKPTVPLSVARDARNAVNGARENSKMSEVETQKQLEEFLLAYARAAPPKIRRAFALGFMQDPSRPIPQILASVKEEFGRPGLETLLGGIRVPSESLGRIDAWQHAEGHDHWTRSDAIRDLIERGLQSVDL